MIKHIIRIHKTLLHNFGAKFFLVPISIGFVMSFSSCDKSGTVGLNVQPPNDLLNIGFDNSTILVTKTVRETHLRTDQGLITSGLGLIGKYIDPIFGETEASMYTQLRQANNLGFTAFGNNPVCDSVVLSLAYANAYYGEAVGRKPLKPQKINVYEITEDLSSSVVYYSDTLRPAYSTHDLVMANHTFIPEISNYVTIGGVNLKPQLRLPFETIFGQTLLNNQSTGNIATNASFQSLFKGMYITAKNTTGLNKGEGRILSYDLENSKLQIYFHNDTSHHNGNMEYDFYLSTVKRFAHFERDTVLRDPNIIAQVADTSRAGNYEKTYIQSLAGLKTKITMPDLLNRANGVPISINQAELVVKVDPASIDYNQDSFDPPVVLILFGIDDSGNSYLIPDLYEPTSSPGYYNANYEPLTHTYHLKISRYIQQVLDKKVKNNGLYLSVSHIRAATSANRAVIGGGANTTGMNNLQMKLNITYTKLH